MPDSPEPLTPSVSLEAPVRAGSSLGFHTSTRLLNDSLIVTSWVQGVAATRIGFYDLAEETWRVLSGVRGMLTDAVPLPGGTVLLLTNLALVEADPATATVLRVLRKGIGRDKSNLRVDDDGHAAIWHRDSGTELRVALDTFELVGRRARKRPIIQPTPLPAARAGVLRVLWQSDTVLIGATRDRPIHPQQVLVLGDDGAEVIARISARGGVESVAVHDGGVWVFPPDLLHSAELLWVPSLPGLPASQG
ncbi:MAG: hypothetical protein ACTJHU_07105 [Mycetocola sp.]